MIEEFPITQESARGLKLPQVYEYQFPSSKELPSAE